MIVKTKLGTEESARLTRFEPTADLSSTNIQKAIEEVASEAAPTAAQFVTLATHADLTVERVLTAGTGITSADAGAGSTFTLSLTAPVTPALGGTGTTTVFTAGSIVFAGASGVYAQDNSNFFWDDGNNRFGIGTATPSTRAHIAGANSSNDYSATSPFTSPRFSAPSHSLWTEGQAANPVTTYTTPSNLITRREVITNQNTTGAANSALFVASMGTNVGASSQVNALGVNAVQTTAGVGDACATFTTADMFGTGVAFAGFFAANAWNSGSKAITIQTDTNNTSGNTPTYSTTATNNHYVGLDVNASGSARSAVGLQLRQISTGAWDVGIGFIPSSIITSSIRDDSNSVNILLGNGAHTNGIKLAGGTFSGVAFDSPGFSVGGTGAIIGISARINQANDSLGSGVNIYNLAGAGSDRWGLTHTSAGNLTISRNAASQSLSFGPSGEINFPGSSTGFTTVIASASAGSTTITLPAVTATFAATASAGTTGQVLTSAGAFTSAMTWTTLAAVATSGSASDLSTGTLPAGRFPALTGDVTTSAGSLATTLATVATAGTTGSSTAIPVITINAKGLTTSITTAAVIAPAGTLSGATLAANVLASSLTSVGTLSALTVTGKVGFNGVTPYSLLGNAASNISDGAAVGMGNQSLGLYANEAGYVQAIHNDSIATNAQGLLIKTDGADSANRVLTCMAAGSNIFFVRGDVVGFGTHTGTADAVSNGHITIVDAGGTTRKLMTTA